MEIKVGDYVKRSVADCTIFKEENNNKVQSIYLNDNMKYAKIILKSGAFVDYNLDLLTKTENTENTENKKLTQGEKDLYYWQYDKLGSFKKRLFDLLVHADSNNLVKLRLGFPEHVNAYQKYVNVSGYWKSIKDRM